MKTRTLNSLWVLILIVLMASCKPKPAQDKTSHQAIKTSNAVSQVNMPEWSDDATIYEVNLRQYTLEGTIEAFKTHLPRLKELGVEILWFMPMHPISEKDRKGTLGSYYAVQDYKAINPEYGSLEEFKQLVKTCHDMGFKVLLDWVANHTGWDNQWVMDHPEWYAKDSLGHISMAWDWADVAQLDYDNEEMRLAMIDAMKFWVAEADIDGYRCDVAGHVPVDFWDAARVELDKVKPVYMLAEDEAVKEMLVNAFNSNYGWEFHHIMNEVAKGEFGVANIKGYFEKVDTTYPEGSYAMHFTSNHDENSWNGTAPERLGEALKPMAVLSFTVPGMPLIYSGQEAGLNKRLEFFEKDEIDWGDLTLQAFYARLIDLKQNNKALWNGKAGSDIHFFQLEKQNALLAFSRSRAENKIVVLMNLSDHKVSNTITCKMIEGSYNDVFSGEDVKYSTNPLVSLDPWEFKVLKAK